MAEFLPILLKISLVLFMVGNLLEMGLRLQFHEALGALRNARFVSQSLLWGFVLCPALACLLARILPLAPAYGMGLILLGMTPGAPFLPMMVEKARGDMGYAAAFMLLALVGTIIYMPLAVSLMATGLSAKAWTIAKPLLSFVLLPLVMGMVVKRASAPFASTISPLVKKTTGVATIVMLILCVVIYHKGFIGAVGTFAIGTQILFFSVITVAPYALGAGLTRSQKSVLSLGLCTRNLGAALAPLFAIAAIDQRTIIMVVIGVPMQTLFSLLAAIWFGRRALLKSESGLPPAAS